MAITQLQATIQGKCPRCRKGNMFTHHPFHLKYGRRVNINCPVCGLRFEPEPAFFEGAMYFNYAMNVAIMTVSGVATFYLLNDPNEYYYFGIAAASILALVSITSRMSKSIMLHLVGGISFDKKYIGESVSSPAN